MGVDAQMYLKYRHCPTEDELRKLQYELMHRFGTRRFCRKDWRTDEPRMFLDLVSEFHQDGSGEYLVNVYLSTRYYGPGYERGPGLEIAVMLLYLAHEHPELEAYYGSDADGGCTEHYGKEEALGLLHYFLTVGHHPHYEFFESFDRRHGKAENPLCAYCRVPMSRYGSGPEYASFICHGCREECEVRGDDFRAWEAGEAFTRKPRNRRYRKGGRRKEDTKED